MAEELLTLEALKEQVDIVQTNANIGYTLLSGFLVFFMQCTQTQPIVDCVLFGS